MSKLKVIYLGPECQENGYGREWCQDDVWERCDCGHESVRYVIGADFDRVAAERDALQQRLNAADQRIDEMSGALTKIHGRCEAFVDDDRDMRVTSVEAVRDIATRALGLQSASERGQGVPGTSFQRLNMLANQGE